MQHQQTKFRHGINLHLKPQKTKDSFSCDKTGLQNFDTSVSMSALAALPQNTPIFSVLQADPKRLTSDIVFYDRTIPLPSIFF